MSSRNISRISTFSLRKRALAAALSQKKVWLALASVMIAASLAWLDATMANIALPSIQRAFGAPILSVSWILNAYNLTFSVTLLPIGKVADRFSRKYLLLFGILLFGLSSLACAFAPDLPILIAARAIQGCAGAIISTVGLAIISSLFVVQFRGIALGAWGAFSGISLAAGPLIGGYLVRFAWSWIFLVNLPICIVSLIVVLIFVPRASATKNTDPIDVLGLSAASVCLFCLVFTFVQSARALPEIVILCTITVLGGIVFIVIERSHTEHAQAPLVDLHLFQPGFAIALVATLFFSIALMGAFVIFSLFLQHILQDDPLRAAFAILPIPLTSFFASALAGKLNTYVPTRIRVIVGLCLLAGGLLWLSRLSGHANETWWPLFWRGGTLGIGMGLCFQGLPTLVLEKVPANTVGIASGFFSVALHCGFTIGTAMLIGILDATRFETTWLVAASCAFIALICTISLKKVIPRPVHRAISHPESVMRSPVIAVLDYTGSSEETDAIQRLLQAGATIIHLPLPAHASSFQPFSSEAFDMLFYQSIWPLYTLLHRYQVQGILAQTHNTLRHKVHSTPFRHTAIERYSRLLVTLMGFPQFNSLHEEEALSFVQKAEDYVIKTVAQRELYDHLYSSITVSLQQQERKAKRHKEEEVKRKTTVQLQRKVVQEKRRRQNPHVSEKERLIV